MKHTFPALCAFACLTIIAGCGGGGGGGSSSAASSGSVATELEGTWVAASDRRFIGGACGLDSSGARGQRTTLTFNINRYSFKEESCVILSGNSGSYFETESGSGTFAIGDITRTGSGPSDQLRALDLISAKTIYTSYNITAGRLRIAIPFQTYDSTSRDRRAFQTGSYYDSASRTLVSTPEFTRQ